MPAGKRRSRPHPKTRPSRSEEPSAAAAASPSSLAQLRQWQEAESLLDELYAPGLEAALGNGAEKESPAEDGERPGSFPEASTEILPPSELASAVSAEELAASSPPPAEPASQPPPAQWSPQAEELDPLQTEIQDLMGVSFRPATSTAAPERELSPPAPEPATWPQGRLPAGSDSLATQSPRALSTSVPATGPQELIEDAHPPSEMPPAAFALEEEIRQLYAAITQEMSTRQGLTGHALSLLREARTIVLSQPERLARARSNVHQVRSLLEAAQAERRRSRRAGMTLLLYLGAVLALSVAMLGFLYTRTDPVTRLSQAFWGEGSRLALYTLPFLGAFWAGGAGASLSALRSLLADLRIGQLFDGRLTLRYLLQPVMGFVLAMLTFLTVAFALNSLAIPWVTHRWLPFLPPVLAFLAGYGQLLVYGLLFQFLRFLTFRPRRRRGPG